MQEGGRGLHSDEGAYGRVGCDERGVMENCVRTGMIACSTSCWALALTALWPQPQVITSAELPKCQGTAMTLIVLGLQKRKQGNAFSESPSQSSSKGSWPEKIMYSNRAHSLNLYAAHPYNVHPVSIATPFKTTRTIPAHPLETLRNSCCNPGTTRRPSDLYSWRRRWAICMSLGMMVTRLAWMAADWVSSKRCTCR